MKKLITNIEEYLKKDTKIKCKGTSTITQKSKMSSFELGRRAINNTKYFSYLIIDSSAGIVGQ